MVTVACRLYLGQMSASELVAMTNGFEACSQVTGVQWRAQHSGSGTVSEQIPESKACISCTGVPALQTLLPSSGLC